MAAALRSTARFFPSAFRAVRRVSELTTAGGVVRLTWTQFEASVLAPITHALLQTVALAWYATQYAYCYTVHALTGRCPHGRGWGNTLLFLRWDDPENSRRTKKCRICGTLHTRAIY